MATSEYGGRTQTALHQLSLLSKQYEDVAEGVRKSAYSPVRHKVFVSYHAADAVEVLEFIEGHIDVFIPRAIGLEEDGTDIIDSTDVDYIRNTIRTKYLKDSTVTLVVIGKCTWARKFVDWEIYSSLRNPNRNGLLAVQMPSVVGASPSIPTRLSLNLSGKDQLSYAAYYVPPASDEHLRNWIETAFQARTSRSSLVELGESLRERNSPC